MFFKETLGSSQIIRGVNAYGLDIGNPHLDAIAGRKPAQLFKTFSLLKRGLRKFSDSLEHMILECVQSDMLVVCMS